MQVNNKAPNFNKITKELLEDMVTYASVTGLNHIKSAFDDGGFTDSSFQAWPKTKYGDGSRSPLVNTGFLRDSNVIEERSLKQIVFANSAPQASIHNEGGIINMRVTDKARRFFWHMYYTNVDKKGNVLSGGSPSEASMWKALALTKKSMISIKIPARPFMKESKVLTDDINGWVAAEIVKRFNKLST